VRTRILLTVSLAAVCLVLASCGGGGDGAEPPLPEGIDTTQALNAPQATDPQPAGDASQDALEEWETQYPTTEQELAADLQQFVDLCAANPDDSGSQLGLLLALAAAGMHNASDYLGYDLFNELSLSSAAGAFARGTVTPELVMGQGVGTLVTRPGQDSSTSRSRGVIPGTDPPLTTEQVQAAIEQLVLPALANAVVRLDALADAAGPDPLISFTANGDTYSLYGADFDAIAASIQLVRVFLLQLVAYNLNPGSYDWDEELRLKDANGNGILTVAEYAPHDPFLTLRSRQSMVDAGGALRGAVSRGRSALQNRTSDPDQLLNQLGLGDTSEIEGNLQDALAILSGQVQFEAEYGDYNWGTDTWSDEGTANVPVNMRSCWDNPISDVKNLFPPLTIEFHGGRYTMNINSTQHTAWFDVWDSEAWMNVSEWGYGDGTMSDHQADLTMNPSSGPAEQWTLTFNDNWTSFTGNASGTAEELYYDYDVEITDFPDKTFDGLFPQGAVTDLIAQDYSKLILSYGSFEIPLASDYP